MVEPGYFENTRAGAPDGVDPRLDNRSVADRAERVDHPAVPQQVDGPDLVHQEEHARAVEAQRREAEGRDTVGMYSVGDHSLGADEDRAGNHAGQADSTLETDPANREASASTAAASETATAGPGERRSRSRTAAKGEESK